MRTFKEAAGVVVACFAFGVAWPAQAGPNFIEGMCDGGDAGSDPSGSCRVTGGAGGNVATITGKINGNPLGPPDFEDMYVILITDTEMFSATTVGPGTAFDTQLWLFRADLFDPLLDGLGLLANDDISAVDDASMLGSMSDDGTGISITTPGIYYLAISGGGGVPGIPGDGRIPFAVPMPQETGPLPIFDFLTSTEISGPDGLGGGLPIFDWLGEGDTGSYVIALEGVSFLEPLCPWDCEPAPDGSVGIVDLLTLLSQWGGPGSCDFDGTGVGIIAFLELLANWGPCP